MGICSDPGNLTIFEEWFGHLTPENANYTTFVKFWEMTFRCFYNSDDLFIPFCPINLTDRILPISCRCTGTENLTNVPIDASLLAAVSHPSICAFVIARVYG